MATLDGFDATQVEPAQEFECIPKGEYLAMAVSSEMVETAAKNGNEFLKIEWELLDEKFKGRKLWSRLNLRNSNDVATKIAMAELSSICHAVGILRPKDSDEFNGKPLLLKVAIEERSDKPGVMSNVVKGYAAANKKSEAKKEATTAGTSKVPPWKMAAKKEDEIPF
jgi:hypothetical protein